MSLKTEVLKCLLKTHVHVGLNNWQASLQGHQARNLAISLADLNISLMVDLFYYGNLVL